MVYLAWAWLAILAAGAVWLIWENMDQFTEILTIGGIVILIMLGCWLTAYSLVVVFGRF